MRRCFPRSGPWSMSKEFDGVYVMGFVEGYRRCRLDRKDPRGYLPPRGGEPIPYTLSLQPSPPPLPPLLSSLQPPPPPSPLSPSLPNSLKFCGGSCDPLLLPP